MSFARRIYTLLMIAALPFAWLRLAWRARRQPEYLQNVSERFGKFNNKNKYLQIIWVHAVSVGETRAAQPLVNALRQQYPDHQILLTHMTPTGRQTGAEIFGGDVLQCYLPYDYPAAVARFLNHYQPRVGVLMETEIWPNLVHACRARSIPAYLVNARLSEKSQRGYQRFAGLTRETLQGLTCIAAQTEADGQRFKALGANNINVTGNIKFDSEIPAAQLALGADWRAAYGERAVLLAASTREGEEALLLDAWSNMDLPNVLLVVVPRHPQRFDEVVRLLDARGLRFQRRSANTAIEVSTQVLLGDSMGEMFAYYAACDLAFIGGSLMPFGCHNLIEASAAGKGVLFGPSTYNFAQTADSAVAAGAAIQVADADALIREAQRLLADRSALQRMGEAGKQFAAAHRGATQRTMVLLQF